ncbi:MAG TPA: hypothetical protein VLI05_06260 [Candidatus Saccharimonadia bacterium]|nr:hypothetical protein [Candidatus Saccharimonadia bacterium]
MESNDSFPLTSYTPSEGDQLLVTDLDALPASTDDSEARFAHFRRILDIGDVSRDNYAASHWHLLSARPAAEIALLLDELLAKYCASFWTGVTIELAFVGPDGTNLDEYTRRYSSALSKNVLASGRLLVYSAEFWAAELETAASWAELDVRRLLDEYFMIRVDRNTPVPLGQLSTFLAAGVISDNLPLRRLLAIEPTANDPGFTGRGFRLRHPQVDPEEFAIYQELRELRRQEPLGY